MQQITHAKHSLPFTTGTFGKGHEPGSGSFARRVFRTLGVFLLPASLVAGMPSFSVHAPERVTAGETVLIEVVPDKSVYSDLLISMGDESFILPRMIHPESDGQDADTPGHTLAINIPAKRPDNLYLWAQMQGSGLEAQWLGPNPRTEWISAQRGANGGLGGGGNGGSGSLEGQTANVSGSAGLPHTGGGGGGGGMEVKAPYTRYSGYAGGSGVVIVRYASQAANSGIRGGSTHDTEGHRIHTFHEDGVFETANALDVNILVVAGGGGGGNGPGGGGGAGGVILTQTTLEPGAYPVIVGAGGAPEKNGEDSRFGDWIAVGGGAGGSRNASGNNGGSGGGAGGGNKLDADFSAGQGLAGQGHPGGKGHHHRSHAEAGGGGGGAGTQGFDGDVKVGSHGGNGILSDISGTPRYYGGGGAGGRRISVDQGWKWGLVGEIPANDPVTQINLSIPAGHKGQLKQALLSANPSFVPNDKTNAFIRWSTNASSVGVHPLRITAQHPQTGDIQEAWLQIEVIPAEEQTTSSPSTQLDKIEYVDLSPAANVPMLPNDPALHIVDAALREQGFLDVGPLHFPLQPDGAAFMAIAQGTTHTGAPEAVVPQAEDLLRVVPEMLPSSLSIELNVRGRYLGFLHGVRGAGKLLDELFTYEVEYESGETVTIPVREGERIAGHLMDYFIKDGVLAYSSLIDGASVNVFFTQWENPHPEKTIKKVTMNASRRIVAFLLGLAVYDESVDLNMTPDQDDVVHVTANFAVHPREFRKSLFSINAQETGQDEEYYEVLAEMNFPNFRMWNSMTPTREDYLRGFDVERDLNDKELRKSRPQLIQQLETFENKYRGHKNHGDSTIFYTLIRKPALWNEDGSRTGQNVAEDPQIFDAVVDWHMDLLKHVYEHHKLPISHVGLYNEVGIGRNRQTRMAQYRLYNALAKRIKETYPELQVGGMSECWPCHNIIGEFLEECGENTDFISWQMYLTGSASTPFSELMDRSDRYAKFTQRIREVNRKVMPDRILPQVISEYNTNYRAWDPSDIRIQKGYGAVWTWSVLRNLLYDGYADIAHYWHSAGRVYGTVRHDATGRDRIRPTGELFQLINNRLPEDTLLCAVNSDKPAEIEGFAAVTPDEYVFALTNRTDREITVEVELLNFDPAPNSNTFARDMELWTINAEDTAFIAQKLPVPKRKHTIVMPPFSMRMFFVEK